MRADHAAMPRSPEPPRETGEVIMDAIRQNPLPAALVAIGIGWLITSGRSRADESGRYGGRYSRDETETIMADRYSAYEYPGSTGERAMMDTAREKVGDAVDTAREKVGDAADTAREAVSGAVESARERVGEAFDATREAVGGAMHSARERVSHVGEGARAMGSSMVDLVQRNPVPAAMAAIGIGWLIASARREGDGYRLTYEGLPHPYDRPGGNGSERRSTVGRAVETAREQAGEIVDQARERAGEVTEQMREQVSDLSARAQDQARRAQGEFERMLHENPLAVAAGAVALGAVVGLAIPETRPEHRLMGEARDRLVETVQQTGQELAQKAQHVAQQTFEAAKQEIGEQGLVEQARQVARDVIDTAREEAEDEHLIPAGGEGKGDTSG
jgi:ElaB/YqjD/DUF883 family membrane-anchored ribosome-binding protein